MNNKIRVLQLVGGGEAIGGVEKMLLNYYSHMDREKVQFDFCFYRESTISLVENQYGQYLQNSEIYELSCFKGKSSFFGYLKAIPKVKKILKKGKYDIVHINSGRPALLVTGMIAARLAKTKIKISHSHSTSGSVQNNSLISKIKKALHKMISNYLVKKSDYLFACSLDAGEYMFGKKALSSPKFIEIRNAIVVEPYIFNEKNRLEIRKEYNVPNNAIVCGHVGRFSEEKNHLLLVDIFEQIHNLIPNSFLWLVGDGALREEVQKAVNNKQLESSVLFFGERKDVNVLMQGMDVFIFPSRYEGLSVTLVEAQAASLPVFASDSISKEHAISHDFFFLSLLEPINEWAKRVVETRKIERINAKDIIRNSGYDISNEAKKLEDLYLKAVQSSEN